MRLIDADALIWNFGEVDDNGAKRWDFFVTADEMREVSTVDAVPIEWIKMRIKRLRGQLVNVAEEDKDIIWDLRTKIDELSGIVEYWRKYHETD